MKGSTEKVSVMQRALPLQGSLIYALEQPVQRPAAMSAWSNGPKLSIMEAEVTAAHGCFTASLPSPCLSRSPQIAISPSSRQGHLGLL